MIEIAAALEATSLAQFFKASRWVYPLVNAGHILGLALLIGAVAQMDVAILRNRSPVEAARGRNFAIAGFLIAVSCGAALFLTQATDYAQNGWFLSKMVLLALAVANAAQHLWVRVIRPKVAAGASLTLWLGVLVSGRMIAYS